MYTASKTKALIRKAALYLVLAALSIQAVFPVLWMTSGSLKTSGELYTNVWGFPKDIQFSNYADAWRDGYIGVYLVNSVLVTAIGMVTLMVTASLTAYALSRLKFPGRNLVFYIILSTMMIPPDIMTIPLFTFVKNLGILNKVFTLPLIYAAGGFGMAVFLLRGYFMGIPKELEEAMSLDGASKMRIFIRLILPLAVPGFITVLVTQSMSMWNEMYLALIFLRKPEMATIPLGLLNFFQQHTVIWPKFFASLTIVTIPVVVAFIFGQKFFVQGLTSGAVKG